MKQSLVFTFTGADRPGIVEGLARTVASHGGNWETSRMVRLAGRFAGVVEVTVEETRATTLAEALQRSSGLAVSVERAARPEPTEGRRLHLALTGQDREGIVREVTGVLAQHGVNIEEMATESVSAAMSGEMMFHAEAELRLPAGLSPEELRTRLERLGGDLMVDISLAEDAG